jgi:bifunctional NMN adenylyltransferase/nudix hydrolase
MNMYSYEFAIFIGRFQPYHNGHHHVIRRALFAAERVIVLRASSFMPPSYRNLWSFQQRRAMMPASFSQPDPIVLAYFP